MESLFTLGLQKGLIRFDEEGNSTQFIRICPARSENFLTEYL